MEYQIKDIPCFEGRYQATSTGEIFSLLSNKFLKLGDDTYNYATCSLNDKTYKVHRIIASTFLENPNNLQQVDHIDRNRKNNNVNNLRYVSQSENQLNKSPFVKKPPHLRNITIKNTSFKVVIQRKDRQTVYRSFKTLDDAINFRDLTLSGSTDAP